MKKGVSPLIAAVLLIAFTMAVAAILTAWISTFTTSHKEKSAEFEVKIQCAYADLRADKNFVRYNSSTGMFSVWLENPGTEKILVLSMVIEYLDGKITRKMTLDEQHVVGLLKEQGGSFGPLNITAYAANTAVSGITVSGSDMPDKVTLLTNCDGVKTSVMRPSTGWVE
ncbi:MAG: type IV pilin [Candidatus Aenigmarchaeota archaeon]|nr:type IV pilin [Candidatus Aenigmarchaeota archaeon]MCK5333416.1 type IV pilin [Candidatus Aenigmarchaeota archaeon]